jgi:phage-related protein
MNLLDLFVKISVDTGDVDKGFSETSSKAESLAGKLKNGLATAAKVGAAALAAAATGVAALTKVSLDQYAEYEQLVGGAKLMFGEAYDYIADKAKNAYSTVQMSQNDYLQQVNGFATGLKTALGGNEQAAAELADRIINAEADVVAATGNSQEAVQNAFNGIMKSNYTMLDNLQIGITPTKEGFQEVIDKVNEWNAANGRATEYQIENLADCQSALVDYIEMVGMQGYASREAADTIQGSVASMKGAWSNLLTGIADENADFKTLTSNFVDSLVAVGKNIIPRISVILGGISQLVTSASTTIIPMVITTITDNLPSLLQAAAALVGALGQGIIDSLPAITQAAIDILFFLSNGLIENLPTLIDGIVQVTMTIVQMLTSPDFLTQLIETAILLITTLAQGLIDAIPQLIAAVPLIIGNLLAAIIVELPNIIQMGIDLLFALIDGIIKCIPELVAAVPTLIIAFINGIVNNLDKIILAGPQIIVSLITGIIGAIPELIAAVPRIIAAIADTIRNYDWGGIGKNIVRGLKNGIAGMWGNIKSWFSDKVNGLVSGVKKILGIASPSKVFAGIGGFMAEGLGEGFDDQFKSVKKDIEGNMSFDAGTITADANIIRNYTSGSYGGGGDSGRIVMLLEQYLPMLANMKVIMDSGQVVGLLAPGMDEELAKINARRARAV